MNRTDRLSAILIMLQTKKVVKSAEIAERFDISQRTVYRDLKALDEAGIPIGAEAGLGYYLIDGYHLPPVMFTPEEAGAMLIAEKLVDIFSDESVKRNFIFASDKIKSVLPESHQTFLGEVDSHIHVFHSQKEQNSQFTNDHITSIQRAISEKKCIELSYYSKYKRESSSRIIEPIGLCFYGFHWHLIAYCRLRKDYRDFRLDRIESLKVNSECTGLKVHISISEYFESTWSQEELYNVKILFKNEAVSSINNSRYYFGYYEEEVSDEGVVMKFAVNDYEYICGWLMSLGDLVLEIISDPIKEMIKSKIKKLSDQYLSSITHL